MFNLFKSWREKHESEFEKHHPYLKQIYIGVALTKFRVNELRENLNIPRFGEKNRKVNAFYLGSIEGDIRKYFDMTNISMPQLMELMILSAGYSAIRDREVNSDAEWGAMIKELQEAFENELDWYRKRGLGFSGLFDEDPEENWDKFVDRISE
ncbi:hypothetical protein HCH_02588 [Hahella chejuensis KCTC 2396]|uniref:Uncharacterized protein n=2 Tax=Hahella chejuensis TaxID=158327 RepID=Q2SIZ3_HAHCH|nr:hypothetical protein HCH_02588 [Hahella chejuensis KCTC 2396]